MSCSKAFCDWVELATARPRPPQPVERRASFRTPYGGGGPGWGVARSGEGSAVIAAHIVELEATPAEGSGIGMARPPSRPPPQGQGCPGKIQA